MRIFLLALFACAPVFAQPTGLAPEWEVRKQLSTLTEHMQRFQPVLEKIDPTTWQNAPAAYTDQLKRIRAEMGYLVTTTQQLSRQPERLTLALTVFFRMQSVDAMLRSLEAGVRKHQNGAIADLLHGLIADEAADRDKLQQYVMDLAADREAEFKVADEEAQRCRALLSKQPQAAGKPAETKGVSR